ncbi:DUF1868 domain-containing protein [Novosphingobium terrae]|uniref:DUF1868 domain-containing protein n=1 Tax=Novosphingobium terrae TaxID=2726189 RepID=UPI00197F2D7B|nr:DUF1868 domain-containing protein [Novosphingobium terrae]
MSSRRTFLAGSTALLAGLGTAARAGSPEQGTPPDVGRKFLANGQVMPFAGNTIICHLPQQGPDSAPFDALLDVYRVLPAREWARKVTVLPPSSYHMTIIGGANDKERRRPLWPADLPLDMPMAECDRILGERLRAFRLGTEAGPYRMRVNPAAPSAKEGPLTMRLLPFDAAEEKRLRRLRDRLSEVLGIQDTGHDTYGFHITLAYQFAALTSAEDAAWREDLAQWKQQIIARAPVITLGPPEYCLLADMFAFKRQFYLE